MLQRLRATREWLNSCSNDSGSLLPAGGEVRRRFRKGYIVLERIKGFSQLLTRSVDVADRPRYGDVFFEAIAANILHGGRTLAQLGNVVAIGRNVAAYQVDAQVHFEHPAVICR